LVPWPTQTGSSDARNAPSTLLVAFAYAERLAGQRPRCSNPSSPPVERALDAYLANRSSGPLFLDDHGRLYVYEAQAWRLVRRLARNAGLKSARQSVLTAFATPSPPASTTPASPRTSKMP
jgi:hypothetical protein